MGKAHRVPRRGGHAGGVSTPARFSLPPVWKRVIGVLLALLLLGVLAVAGLLWWLFFKDAPRDHALDSARWQTVQAQVSSDRNPRRDMVRAAQRWLEREHPTQAQVRARLGAPDSQESDTESWNVGCYDDWLCMDTSALVVTYRQGQVRSAQIVQY